MVAEEARQAKALEQLSHTLRDISKVLQAMNENMVVVGRTFKAWLDTTDDEKEGETMSDETVPVDNDAVEVHDLVADINELQGDAGRDTTIAKPKK
jgi:hypothetical protein